MQRDYSPLERCRECGQVTAMLVHEQGLGDDGEPYAAIYRDTLAHTRSECERMVALAREEWPTLW